MSQVPPVEVEFSDKPELAPLTLTHVQGPLILVWGLGLCLASLAWLSELFVGNKKEDVRVDHGSRSPNMKVELNNNRDPALSAVV